MEFDSFFGSAEQRILVELWYDWINQTVCFEEFWYR